MRGGCLGSGDYRSNHAGRRHRTPTITKQTHCHSGTAALRVLRPLAAQNLQDCADQKGKARDIVPILEFGFFRREVVGLLLGSYASSQPCPRSQNRQRRSFSSTSCIVKIAGYATAIRGMANTLPSHTIAAATARSRRAGRAICFSAAAVTNRHSSIWNGIENLLLAVAGNSSNREAAVRLPRGLRTGFERVTGLPARPASVWGHRACRPACCGIPDRRTGCAAERSCRRGEV